MASSLLALSSGSLLLSERMTVLVSFSRQSQTGVLQLLEPFFTGSRSEEEGAEAHGPEDRPSAGRSSFFLLPWNCLQFVLKAFSFSRQALLACCCNTPGIHNKLAGNESDRARTAVHRPRTRWSRFCFWERIFSKTAHLIPFVLRQATVGTLLCDRMILLFSKKPSKNEESYLLIETRDRKQKK